jgi:acyl transferase domain-containing protein
MAATSETDIAVIGMSCRFPGAGDPATFWRNLIEGRESITFFSREELAAAGLARSLYDRPGYVRARGVLPGIERFDAPLFDMTPAEAAMTDPQHRLFLECAWEAMEDGGYHGDGFAGPIGVYGGCGAGGYLRDHVLPHAAGTDLAGLYQIMQANEKDFLATRTAYKLHLTGPAITVQTACSTSLVAVHCACQAILNGECDMALAGGVSIFLPRISGYLYQEGMILSPDGHCRAFDALAAGTVMGSGAGLVLMKRLEDAVHDRDFIYGVIKGSAVNNDGAGKVGFAAPGVDGQVRVISEALAVAGVDPADIGYVETHGTATPMGDPVEIEALGRAFGKSFGRTRQRGTCLIGSVKTNIGHCDAAAGIAGLIKTLLALQHGRIPPSLHFVNANPAIDFGSSPFRVCTVPTAWPPAGGQRLAGVSSFGMGGTNAHMIVGEAPARRKFPRSRGCCLLPISAKTATALAETSGRLVRHIDTHPEDDLADIAFSLQAGRRPQNHRTFVVSSSGNEASAALAEFQAAGRNRHSSLAGTGSPAIAFMFPGQGSQYVGMAREVYGVEKTFRDAFNLCAETLNPLLARDLRQYITGSDDWLADELRQTAIAQPVLFAVEYAYAMLLAGWDIRPQAVIGHSLGEYVAACLAGVFTLADALKLVAARGALMQRQAKGMMVAVARSADELAPLLNADVALAAVNPGSCTLSGPSPAIRQLVARFAGEGVAHSVLKTSHAFHSAMFDAAMEEFAAIVATVSRSAPRIPLISNLTGGPLSDREAIDPWYWARHLRHTVRFGDGLDSLLTEPGRLLVEVGPGRILTGMALYGGVPGANRKVVAVDRRDGGDSIRSLLAAVGEMWAFGVPVDWQAMAGEDKAGRLPLPTYPFERQGYWIDAPARGLVEATSPPTPEGRLSAQQWRRLPHLDGDIDADVQDRWILIADPGPVADGIARSLTSRGCRPTLVAPAETSFDFIAGEGSLHLVYLPSLQAPSPSAMLPEQALSFTLALAGALERDRPAGPVFCDILTYGIYDITGDEQLVPPHSALAAAVHSLSREYPALHCRCIDCGQSSAGEAWPESRVETLVRELMHPGEQAAIALRGGYRWLEYYQPIPQPAGETGLRRGGTYLITGGLGDIGLSLADHLSQHFQANLVLTRKSPFPAPAEWPAWLAKHGENDAASGVIRRLLAVQERGSAVLAVAADVASRKEMQAVIDLAERLFGKIDGCIHAAGVTGAAAIRPYRELTLDNFAALLSAKLTGYRVLRELMQDRAPDFLIAMSSLSAVLGGSGMGAYGAANAAMAAQIAADNRAGGRWLCIDWDGWRFDERPPHPQDDNGILRYAIPASAGVDHLARLTQWQGGGRIAVSTTDLNDRARRRSPEPRREPPVQTDDDHADAGREPFSPEEELVAGIWRSVLGTKSIRRHDSFFSLGGSSLQITQVHSRLKESLGVDFPLRRLFEAPKLADMADLVCRQRVRPGEKPPASREEMEF